MLGGVCSSSRRVRRADAGQNWTEVVWCSGGSVSVVEWATLLLMLLHVC